MDRHSRLILIMYGVIVLMVFLVVLMACRPLDPGAKPGKSSPGGDAVVIYSYGMNEVIRVEDPEKSRTCYIVINRGGIWCTE